jgi:hypothetical protein
MASDRTDPSFRSERPSAYCSRKADTPRCSDFRGDALSFTY